MRKARVQGNAGTLLQYRFYPREAGTYNWTVQTVNAAFAGSTLTQGEAFTLTAEQLPTAIHTPHSSAALPAEHYSLQGLRVPASQPGIHIVRQGTSVKRVMVK